MTHGQNPLWGPSRPLYADNMPSIVVYSLFVDVELVLFIWLHLSIGN